MSFIYYLQFIPILALILLNINFALASHKPYKEKKTPFECGYHSFLAQNRTQFTISFFIFALLFLLFDLEIVLIYPFTVSTYTNNTYGLVIMIIFTVMLTLGFVFELGKKALTIDTKQDNFNTEKTISNSKVLYSSMSIYIFSLKFILSYLYSVNIALRNFILNFSLSYYCKLMYNSVIFRLKLFIICYLFIFFIGIPSNMIGLLIFGCLVLYYSVNIYNKSKKNTTFILYYATLLICNITILYTSWYIIVKITGYILPWIAVPLLANFATISFEDILDNYKSEYNSDLNLYSSNVKASPLGTPVGSPFFTSSGSPSGSSSGGSSPTPTPGGSGGPNSPPLAPQSDDSDEAFDENAIREKRTKWVTRRYNIFEILTGQEKTWMNTWRNVFSNSGQRLDILIPESLNLENRVVAHQQVVDMAYHDLYRTKLEAQVAWVHSMDPTVPRIHAMYYFGYDIEINEDTSWEGHQAWKEAVARKKAILHEKHSIQDHLKQTLIEVRNRKYHEAYRRAFLRKYSDVMSKKYTQVNPSEPITAEELQKWREFHEESKKWFRE